ncbi:unnamed protein product [Ectocarpus sp. 12 AP-2014]
MGVWGGVWKAGERFGNNGKAKRGRDRDRDREKAARQHRATDTERNSKDIEKGGRWERATGRQICSSTYRVGITLHFYHYPYASYNYLSRESAESVKKEHPILILTDFDTHRETTQRSHTRFIGPVGTYVSAKITNPPLVAQSSD